jgi:hypothetical protein
LIQTDEESLFANLRLAERGDPPDELGRRPLSGG